MPGCRKTPDGSAYPLDFPWGNLGSITNGICLSAMYQHLNFDAADSAARVGNRCFMHEQIGYIFNHKCATEGSSCNTEGDEGFSYMVGYVILRYLLHNLFRILPECREARVQSDELPGRGILTPSTP